MFGQTAPMLRALTYATITDSQLVAIVGLLITLIFGTPLAWVAATTWAGVVKLRLKAELKQQVIALKQQMIERGMTADEIVRVVGPPTEALDELSDDNDDDAVVLTNPCACEVVVGRDGEWHSALALGRKGDRYLIHTCPGYGEADMSENEWVKADRVRLAAAANGQDGSPRGSAGAAEAFDSGQWRGQPKKDPVPAEV